MGPFIYRLETNRREFTPVRQYRGGDAATHKRLPTVIVNRPSRFGALIAMAVTVTVAAGLVRGTAASATAQLTAATEVPPSPPRSVSINRTNARLRVDQAHGISSKRVLFAPSNAGLAAVSGIPTEGETLTVGSGRWTGSKPIRYADQWRRCAYIGSDCADIPGAKGPTYKLTVSDVGATLRVRVTATNPAGSRGATSAPTAVVVAAAPKSISPPAISGLLAEGQVLTITTGSWTGFTPMTFTYQWRRCQATGPICNDIAGATRQTYTLTASEVGAMLRVRVTASNSTGSSATTSAPTMVVAASAPKNITLPLSQGLPGRARP